VEQSSRGKKAEKWRSLHKELRVRVCVCVFVHALYLYVNAFTDGRIFGWTLINRWEHFVTERLSRITIELSCQLGISVCRIARRDSRSCVTILGTIKITDSKR